jgi:hypothetical protein
MKQVIALFVLLLTTLASGQSADGLVPTNERWSTTGRRYGNDCGTSTAGIQSTGNGSTSVRQSEPIVNVRDYGVDCTPLHAFLAARHSHRVQLNSCTVTTKTTQANQWKISYTSGNHSRRHRAQRRGPQLKFYMCGQLA